MILFISMELSDQCKDDKIRTIEVEYQNQNENAKRKTFRGVREIVVISAQSYSRANSYHLCKFDAVA